MKYVLIIISVVILVLFVEFFIKFKKLDGVLTKKKKKELTVRLSIISFFIILLFLFYILYVLLFNTKYDYVKDGYIAVFHGGSGEITYSTYIYKIDNGQSNMGFEYINTVSKTASWGSTEWIQEVVDSGEFSFTDGAFIVAQKHVDNSLIFRELSFKYNKQIGAKLKVNEDSLCFNKTKIFNLNELVLKIYCLDIENNNLNISCCLDCIYNSKYDIYVKSNGKYIKCNKSLHKDGTSNIYDSDFDYLLPFFDSDLFTDEIYDKMVMNDTDFIRSDEKKQIGKLSKVENRGDKLGTLNLLIIIPAP